MTTAHRPTFDPARGQGNSAAPTRQYSSRSLPAHKKLKYRQPGQGGEAGNPVSSDAVKEELLAAERAHREKHGLEATAKSATEPQKLIASAAEQDTTEEARRQQIIEATRDIDADDSDDDEEGGDGSAGEDDSEEEDETAELMRELAKIKAERAAEKAQKEADLAAEEQARREEEIAFGNPLMNDPSSDFSLKRRWDEDVVFRVKEKDTSGKKDFVNDLLRSDFHRSFMKKYVR